MTNDWFYSDGTIKDELVNNVLYSNPGKTWETMLKEYKNRDDETVKLD